MDGGFNTPPQTEENVYRIVINNFFTLLKKIYIRHELMTI